MLNHKVILQCSGHAGACLKQKSLMFGVD